MAGLHSSGLHVTPIVWIGWALGVLACSSEPGVIPCDSTLDCPPASVCDRARGECVECVMDADCLGAAERCVGSMCVVRTTCTTSRQCPGQVCDLAREICVDCAADIDCSDGLVCADDGTCAEPTVGCLPSTRLCASQTEFVVCDSEGRFSDAQACLTGQTCVDGTCADRSCAPACGADEVCVDATCVPLECAPSCTADEVCDAGVCRCGEGPRCSTGFECEGGRCEPTACEPSCPVGEECVGGDCGCGEGPRVRLTRRAWRENA